MGDVFTAGVLLLVSAPILLVTGVLLLLINRGSVIFLQQRSGYKGRPFTIIKLKTMKDAYDDQGVPLPDEVRLTRIGKVIRSLSIDELPQLINVIKGEMSLVGPRPLLIRYMDRYSARQARRHEVKPGITGWAQVNGRNASSWEERFERDVWYVDHQSFWLDLRILVLTAYKVLKKSEVSDGGHATKEEFWGSAK